MTVDSEKSNYSATCSKRYWTTRNIEPSSPPVPLHRRDVHNANARKNRPFTVHCDNAPCFTAAAKEYVGPNGRRMTWRFIPPRCPSMGGAWERLVGAVKIALTAMELPKVPQEETLRRALLRAERLVKSRPLTDIATDAEEEEALTPNHFLVGSSMGLHGGGAATPEIGIRSAA